MSRSLLADAFAHHAWATLRLIDTCLGLTPEQLHAEVPGTFGPILPTMRHLVGADAAYLFAMTGGRRPIIDDGAMGLPELRAAMERNAAEWGTFLAQDLDPEAIVVRRRTDGSESHAPLGIRMAQAVHHGTDHRSQVCTILTTLGVEPPAIDAWDFADHQGRLLEIPPAS